MSGRPLVVIAAVVSSATAAYKQVALADGDPSFGTVGAAARTTTAEEIRVYAPTWPPHGWRPDDLGSCMCELASPEANVIPRTPALPAEHATRWG